MEDVAIPVPVIPPKAALLEGDAGKQLMALSLPLMWGLLAMSAFGVVDTFFISQLGTKYLAAFGFTMPVIMFFLAVCFGTCIGTTSAISRIYGKGDMEGVRRVSTDALLLMVTLTTIASVFGTLLLDPVFKLMGATPDLLPLIRQFMRIWYAGLPFFGLMMVGNACIRATGDTKFPSSMMTLQAVLTIIIDPFLIFGWGGLPRLELAGAAWTLLIAYVISCVISLIRMGYHRKALSAVVFHKGIFKSWKKILHVALPSIFSNQISPISAAIIVWMASSFGHEAVAALGVAGRIEGLALLVPYAFNAGVAIFVGQNFGAGNFSRVRDVVAIAARYCLFWGLFIAVIFFVFAKQVPHLFDDNLMVVSYVSQYLRWVPISFGALGVMVVCNSAMNAMGKPLPAVAVMILKAFVLYVPVAYVLQSRFGFAGILMALMGTNFTVGIAAYLWNRKEAS